MEVKASLSFISFFNLLVNSLVNPLTCCVLLPVTPSIQVALCVFMSRCDISVWNKPRHVTTCSRVLPTGFVLFSEVVLNLVVLWRPAQQHLAEEDEPPPSDYIQLT